MTPTRSRDSPEQWIGALTATQPFAVHWQIRDLTARATPALDTPGIGHAAETQLASFSTRKVSVLLACLALIHRGDLALEKTLPITEGMKEGVQAGIMKNVSAGAELTLEDHLRQMMITSDNICTQLVFDAIGQAAQFGSAQPTSLHQEDRAAAALQWVNDYCAWIGLHSTLHREIFPRSGELTWHHGIEHMTVTSAADQAHLLAQLGRGTHDPEAAAALHLDTHLCRFAVELMRGIYTPLLGAEASATGDATLRFAEKNGRGLRSLSQVGLATTDDGAPIAAVAIFAENIPTQLPCGTPGRIAAYELFGAIGRTLEAWHLGEAPAVEPLRPTLAPPPGKTYASPYESMNHPVMQRMEALPPGAHAAAGGVINGGTDGGNRGRDVGGSNELHPLAGVGKLFAALALAELETADPGVLDARVTITAEHRRAAAVGPLRIHNGHGTHAGDLTLNLHDALGLIISTADAAASLALRTTLEERGLDLAALTQGLIDRFQVGDTTNFHTRIAGLEDPQAARGDLLIGETTTHELRQFLMLLTGYGGLCGEDIPDRLGMGFGPAAARRVLGWMSQVFEPAGLAYGLPGYGPKKVPQWTVSGLETRPPKTSASLEESPQPEGWTSVLITRRPGVDSPQQGEPRHGGLLWMAAHVPARAEGAGAGARSRTGREAARIFGELGLALSRHGLSD